MTLTHAFLVITLSVVPLSSQADAPKAFGGALAVLLQEQAISPDDRKIVAKGFEVECGKLSEKIPELSPRENDWVNAEIKAGRIVTLFDTVEFAKRQSKRTLMACHKLARVIPMSGDEVIETAFWADFLLAILDEHLLDHVRRIKVSNAASITDRDIDFIKLFPMAARLITKKILIPRLN